MSKTIVNMHRPSDIDTRLNGWGRLISRIYHKEGFTMKKLFYKNHVYTLEELDCKYCLYHQKSRDPCPLEVCCCAAEKREALRKIQARNKAASEHLLQGI